MMVKQHAAYFVDDAYIAEYWCSEIRKFNKTVEIRKFGDIEQYFNQIIMSYTRANYIDVAFQYFKLHSLLNELDPKDKVIDIVINTHVSSVKVVFTPLNMLPMCESIDDREIARYYLEGRDLRSSPRNIIQKISEQAYLLSRLRSVYINKRHLNLKEFLEEILINVLGQFNGIHHKFILYGNKEQTEVYKKENDDSALQGIQPDKAFLSRNQIKIFAVDEVPDKAARAKLKSLRAKNQVILPIQSKYASGYISFFTRLPTISTSDKETLALILYHLALAIDNTYYFNRLTNNEGSLHSIFEDSDDGIIIVGPDRKVMDINDAAQQFTGWDKGRAIGESCKKLYKSCLPNGQCLCDSSRCPMFDPLLKQKKIFLPRIITLTRNGKQKIVQSKYSFVKAGESDIVYGVAVVRDITKKVQFEQKLQSFERLSALGKFAAELTHEIRNPITGISSNAQFLFEEKSISKEYRMIAKEIMRGASMVEETVQKMLHIANPGNPVFGEEDINMIVQSALQLLKNKLKRSGIQLRLSLAKHLPPVYIDGNLINQVLLNMFINSMESMKNGGMLSVSTRVTKMKETKDKDHACVKIRIKDTGCGIAPENMGQIFDPFFTTKETGSGLGLYSSYRILRDHDASLVVDSTEDEGTQICITFKTKSNNQNST
ncbi:putative Histidine kinase [Desulfosarcina cetonica]|nr:putative Histidine kinase [Desulfosarcina cetonica]